MQETRDPLDNVVSATVLDYRVLQPSLVTDPNGNRAEVAFDTFGFVTGTAIRGKVDDVGDSLDGFEPDLEVEDPLDDPHGILMEATSRMPNIGLECF